MQSDTTHVYIKMPRVPNMRREIVVVFENAASSKGGRRSIQVRTYHLDSPLIDIPVILHGHHFHCHRLSG